MSMGEVLISLSSAHSAGALWGNLAAPLRAARAVRAGYLRFHRGCFKCIGNGVIVVLALCWWRRSPSGCFFAQTTRRVAPKLSVFVWPPAVLSKSTGPRVHYVDQGSGRPILMIHGLGGQLHHMLRPLMEVFGDGYA